MVRKGKGGGGLRIMRCVCACVRAGPGGSAGEPGIMSEMRAQNITHRSGYGVVGCS